MGAQDLKEKNICVLCINYIYTGTLKEVTIDCLTLINPKIVYETGAWTDPDWKNAHKLPTQELHIERSTVESMFEITRSAAK